MKKAYLRRYDCCDQELLNIIENGRSEDLVEDKVKSEPTLGSDHSRSVGMQRRWFLDSANMRCVPHLKKYIEFWRYLVMSFLYLEKDDLERADDQ